MHHRGHMLAEQVLACTLLKHGNHSGGLGQGGQVAGEEGGGEEKGEEQQGRAACCCTHQPRQLTRTHPHLCSPEA